MKKIKIDATDYEHEPAQFPALEVIDLKSEGNAVIDDYRNTVITQVNDHCLRLSAMIGAYPWHSHPDSDELFLVIHGQLTIELEDGRKLQLYPWQAVTVPAGTVHRTFAQGRVINLCFEMAAAKTEIVD